MASEKDEQTLLGEQYSSQYYVDYIGIRARARLRANQHGNVTLMAFFVIADVLVLAADTE